MLDDYDPSEDPDLQLTLGGSLSLTLAPELLAKKRDYIERVESLLEAAKLGRIAGISFDEVDVIVFSSELRESFLVNVIAYLEDLCRGACDDFAVVLRSDIRERDFGDRSVFERTRRFLSKVMREDDPSDAYWEQLDKYRTARNAVAHRGQLWIDERDSRGRKKVESLPGVSVDEYGALKLDREFCSKLLDFCDALINEFILIAERAAARAKRFQSESEKGPGTKR